MPLNPNEIQWDAPASQAAPPSPSGIRWDGDPAPAQPLSAFDQFKRQLGLTARAGIEGVTGTGAAIGDFGYGAANAVGNLVNGKPVFTGPSPSQAQSELLTRLGLPKPETPIEKGVGIGASMLAGGMDPAINAAQKAAQAMNPSNLVTPNNAQAMVTKELHDAGYQLPPTEMGGGVISRSIEGFGGSNRTAHLAEYNNQPVSQDLARAALNLPKNTPLTSDVLENQAQQLIREGYDPIRRVPTITVGSTLRNDLRQIAQDLGGSNSFPLTQEGNDVNRLVQQYLFNGQTDRFGNPRYVQSYTGEDAITHVKNLRKEASADFRTGDPLLGEAKRRIATALEDNIETSLRNNGSALVDKFRDTRTMLAKNNAVDRMLSDPSTGNISTTKAATLLNRGMPLSDGLDTIAKAGGPMYSRATGVPVSGKPPAINFGDSVLYGAGAGGTLAGGGPFASLLAAYPALRAGARYGVLSKPVQAIMASNLDPQQGLFAAARNRALVSGFHSQMFNQDQQ